MFDKRLVAHESVQIAVSALEGVHERLSVYRETDLEAVHFVLYRADVQSSKLQINSVY